MLKRHALGIAGEQLAAERLRALGYEVVTSRFACRHGDIDLVCRHRGEVALVEVKTRSTFSHGTPLEALTEAKERSLRACAAEYRRLSGWKGVIRLHLAAVFLGYGAGEGRFELHTDVLG